ncbi:MAG TPA: transcriptional repressor [Candidatus Obscuribacterales bacterium]
MPGTSAEVILLSRGVKPTAQRVVITQYLLDTDSHPTADQILAAVADRLPVPLSRATVYNTLNALVEAGVIQEVYTEPGGSARYDANTEQHHHFVDVKTGKITDIPFETVPALEKQLGNKFTVANYTVTFYGEAKDEAS